MNKYAITLLVFLLALSCNSYGAEYLGSDIDGETYDCTAFSYETGKYYYVTCEFSGDEVILYFPKGGHKEISMDSEEIDDPSSIDAFDYEKGTYWEIDVEI